MTQDLSLKVGVVSGTVQFPWGGRVSFPNAIFSRALPFFTETLFATRVDDQGRFGIVVREAGDYVLTVQDPNSGLSTIFPVSVVDATQVTDVGLISLPETMSVGGQVTDHTGEVVANATVGLTSSVGADLVYTTATDENGKASSLRRRWARLIACRPALALATRPAAAAGPRRSVMRVSS